MGGLFQRLELFRCLLLQGFLRKQFGRWLPKLLQIWCQRENSKTSKQGKLEKFTFNFGPLLWYEHIILNCIANISGVKIYHQSKVFPTKIWTGFSDFVVLWDIWRPLLFCHFLQSRIGLGFFLRIQQILGLAGSMPQVSGGFGGGGVVNLRHVKVLRGKKSMGKHGKGLKVVFFQKITIIQQFFPLDVTPWWPTPTTQRHSGRHR